MEVDYLLGHKTQMQEIEDLFKEGMVDRTGPLKRSIGAWCGGAYLGETQAGGSS